MPRLLLFSIGLSTEEHLRARLCRRKYTFARRLLDKQIRRLQSGASLTVKCSVSSEPLSQEVNICWGKSAIIGVIERESLN